MKILAPQQELSAALALIQGIVEKNSIKPITANALIGVSPEGVFVSATNLQIGVRTLCDGIKIKTPGEISVNARRIFEIVKELPEKEVCIEEKGNYRVEISCGKDHFFTILGLPPEDFPLFSQEEELGVEWNKNVFLKMLYTTFFSVSKDDSKINICGSHLENIEGGQTRVVTTDGYRLSIRDDKPGKQLSLPEGGITVPQKAVHEIIKILTEKKAIEKIYVNFINNILYLVIGNIKFFIRIIEKRFPEYNIIIPGEGQEKITFLLEKNKIKPALKRISIISEENKNPVFFNFNKKELFIKTDDYEVGSAQEIVIIKEEHEKEINFSLNCMYILDVLNIVDSDILLEYIFKENSPIILKPIKEEISAKYIIMPLVQ